ncbi:PepSY domain-containing protein [Dyella sp. GSA-30]|uniref:PepSY-associated TM helix domain-containing protein n=1 Tax=Dyella sp. GSA-30 TaxID=2994496 RepID=UPI0024929B37|nr:PepSY domain-containing protein [Dyella sp. GSA-30]BDU18954.1 membrane protein [Dyella sp. GSA-30]
MNTPALAAMRPSSSGYRLLWRWHFYAGLFCLPFVLWLACTGLIYLFKPQIEPLLEQRYAQVADAPAQPASAQVAAALAAVPGTMLNAYQVPSSSTAAAQVLLGRGSEIIRVYVDPASLRVLHVVSENDRFMRVIFYLHGELMLGSAGSMVVELAASWTILMLLTGLYLWWPRGRRLAGVFYPRLNQRGRVFWRDLHAVTAVWVSLLALFLLMSGLPWAKSWGGLLRDARQSWTHAHVVQDWTIGSADARAQAAAENTPPDDEHAMHHGMAGMEHMHATPVDLAVLDRVLPAVLAQHIAAPVLIAPPSMKKTQWSARSDAADRSQRADLTLDPSSGLVIRRVDFAQRPLLDRLIGYGVAVHEGALFPPLNQVLSAFTALGLITTCLSAVVMWWRRRPHGVLGAPPVHADARHPRVFVALLVLLGIFLPLLGASMLTVLIVERVALRHWSGARHFLGLAVTEGGSS